MKETRTAVYVVLFFSLLLGVFYPLFVTGVGQLIFPWRANGSLVSSAGRVVGSELIGQAFSSPRYFHGRPSASSYDPMSSGASNFGPSNQVFIVAVSARVERVREENGLPEGVPVPADLVLASASGLDPEITLEAALVQVERVAASRGLPADDVRGLVRRMVLAPFLGAFGELRVNVLLLNLALDTLS